MTYTRENTEQPDTCPCHYCGTEITHFGGDWWEDNRGNRDCPTSPIQAHLSLPLFQGWDDPRPTSKCQHCHGTGKADDHNDCGFCYPDSD